MPNHNTPTLEGAPTVLVVDDEELMREVTTAMVEECGGKVFTAVDGLDAVEVFADNADTIDVVLMDFSMPNMNGFEAYQEIRKVSGRVSFVFISGLPITPEVSEVCESDQAVFLSKPFSEDLLIDHINQVKK